METYTRDEIDKLNQIFMKMGDEDGKTYLKDIPDEFLCTILEKVFSIEEGPFAEESDRQGRSF